MGLLVGLTPQLAGRSSDALCDLLRERGLSVLAGPGPIDAAGPGPQEAAPVLTALVQELRSHDAVVVTVPDPQRWSGLLDAFLGPAFRLLCCADEPPGRNFSYATADFVVGPEQGDRHGLAYAVTALTGGPELRADRHEHALFLAEAQARRSAGMRGATGCVLLDEVGDVVALGANEVPRAGGGQYWADSPDDARDLHRGVDPAWESKMALVRSVLEYTEWERGGALGDLPSLAARFLDHLDNGAQGPPSHDGAAQALESLGRVVHAELAALASAARHGAGVAGTEAVVTRPPCRQCLRQLVVSGVSRISFLGPADAARHPFHADALTGDEATPGKVRVVPFGGVTPRGYDKTFGNRHASAGTLGSALVEAAQEPPAALLRTLLDHA